jgi:cytoskeletal protein CcmA (bactofilin family)
MKNGKESGSTINLIGKGTHIEGTLRSNTSIVIHGRVKGDIFCEQNITLGVDGVIEGNVQAVTATIGGSITGTLKAAEKIILESHSQLHGDLKTSKLVIDEGAVFDGQSRMADSGSQDKKQA